MRRIDKSTILSTEYKTKLEELDKAGKKHPGKSWEYSTDVVMNLLFCQRGVCAYTEMRLCSPELLKEDKWQDGRYNNHKVIVDENGYLVQLDSKSRKVGKFGSLDHYDPALKVETYWDWNNLFVVHSDINIEKHDEPVDDILKPDSPAYNPGDVLTYIENTGAADHEKNSKKEEWTVIKNNLGYVIETHYFVAHPDRHAEERKRINRMIAVLGLNHETVRYERQTYLNMVRAKEFIDEKLEIDRFFTAVEMVRRAKTQEEGREP